MGLTREEYRNLFDDLERIVEVACESNECISYPLKRKGICIKADVEVGFEQLINEYFDNPEITSISAYRILKYKIDELEKALDKACSELESLELNIEDTDDVKYPRKQKHEWKEYLLNDIS